MAVRIRRGWMAGVLFAGALMSGGVRADDSDLRKEVEDLRKETQELREELKEMRQLLQEKHGEAPAPAPPVAEVKPAESSKEGTPVAASFKDGLKIRSADGNFTMDIGGRLEFQSRTFTSRNPGASTFSDREARLQVEGTLYRDWGYKVQYDLSPSTVSGSSTARLREGFVDWRRHPECVLRAGQWKEPFSLQQLTSSRFIDFVERSVPDRLVPGYDAGIGVSGKPWDPYLSYEVGVFNGNGFNTSDNNDDKDIAARIVLKPWGASDSRWLKGLQVGGSFTSGNQTGAMGGFSSPSTNTTFIGMNSGVVARGGRQRWGGELAWLVGPFKLQGEYIASRMDLKRTAVSGRVREIDFDGGYVEALYVLSGEDAVLLRRKPKSLFLVDGGWGQWEVAGRYARFNADSELFRTGAQGGSALAAPEGSPTSAATDGLDEWTIGLNWWPNPNTRLSLNWVRNEYDDRVAFGGGAGSEDSEEAVLFRFQLDF